MSENPKKFIKVPLDQIFLDHNNPRHEPYDTQAEVIEYLCRDEEVEQLARDITEHGLSPFDRYGVMTVDPDDPASAFYMTEGNRRLCAMKLLSDPELAPANKKAYFEKLSKDWDPITNVECWVADDPNEVKFWLDRRHQGYQGGIGQKQWTADQKARHSGANSKERVALEFLNWAEANDLITKDQRKGKLTTVSRYLSNPVLRETMGILYSDADGMQFTRPENDFNLIVTKFLSDLTGPDPKVNSRAKRKNIVEYARELGGHKGVSQDRVDPQSPSSSEPSAQAQKKFPSHLPITRLPHNKQVWEAIQASENSKLISLYSSVCKISLKANVPLLSVGVWSFFETLTAAMGRKTNVDFVSYLTIEKVQGYGLGDKQKTRTLRAVLSRIQDFGNTTKHHETAAAFNGEQLANDFETLSPLILCCITEIAQN